MTSSLSSLFTAVFSVTTKLTVAKGLNEMVVFVALDKIALVFLEGMGNLTVSNDGLHGFGVGIRSIGLYCVLTDFVETWLPIHLLTVM